MAVTKSKKKQFVFIIIILCCALLVSELFLQLAARAVPSVHDLLAENVRDQRTIDDPILGHRPNPDFSEHDRNGFRNLQVPESADIVTLGDSQTYGVSAAPTESWPYQLGLLNNTTVYNMAFGGYGPIHSLILWEEALHFHPHLIIEAFYAGNDLYDSYNIVYNRNILPELKTSDETLLQTIKDLEQQQPIAQEVVRTLSMGINERGGILWNVRKFFSAESKLYGLARAIKRTLLPELMKHLGFYSEWDAAKQFAEQNQPYCQIFDSGQFKTVFRSQYRFTALNLDDPRINEGLRLSLEALRQMQELAIQEHIRFFVLLIPTKELVFRELVQQNSSDFAENYQELVSMEEHFWQRTRTFLQEQGIDYLDMTQALRKSLKYGKQPYDMTFDGHPNAIGYRAIAEQVASYVGRN